MTIQNEKVAAAGGGPSRAAVMSVFGAAIAGLGLTGFLVYRSFKPEPKTDAKVVGADEARIAAKGEAAKKKAEVLGNKVKQADVGQGYTFDDQGNYLPQAVDKDLPANQPVFHADMPAGAREGISAGIERSSSGPKSYKPDQNEGADPATIRERRENKKEDRSELRASNLGYSRLKMAHDGGGTGGANHQKSLSSDGDQAQIEANNQAIQRLTTLAEKGMAEAGSAGPAVAVNVAGGSGPAGGPAVGGPRMPAEMTSQPAAPGEVADMRIGGGVGPDVVVREGKFLDCVLVNKVESDIAESPVTVKVSRDFVSLDGKYVLFPAGTTLLGTAGRVVSLQQARLFIKFHRVIFPNQKTAYFPHRDFPAMDQYGSLGVKDKVNYHVMMQFGAAIALGVFDGFGAAFSAGSSSQDPTARQLVMAQMAQNFGQVAGQIIQRYANVVPTITLPSGKKMKVYFTSDVVVTPYLRTSELSWVQGGTR